MQGQEPQLAELLSESRATILDRWIALVEPALPESLTRPEIVDDIPAFLDALVQAARDGAVVLPVARLGEAHGARRQRAGLDVDEVVFEYEALRECILDVGAERGHPLTHSEQKLVHRAIGRGVAEAVRQHAAAKQSALLALDAERERILEALRAEHRRLVATIEQVPVGLGVYDRQGALVLSNARLAEIHGGTLTAEPAGRSPEPAGRNPEREGPEREDGSPTHLDARPVLRALGGEEVVNAQRTLVRADGSRISVETSARPIRDESGAIVGAVSVSADVTERKRVERALARAAERLHVVAEASRALAVSTTIDAIAWSIVRLLGDAVGEVCSFRAVSGDGRWVEMLAVHAQDPAIAWYAQQLLEHPVGRADASQIAFVLREPRTHVLCAGDLERAMDPSLGPGGDVLPRPHAALVVPVLVEARVVAVIALVRVRSREPYADDDVRMLEDVARRVADAIANAQLMRGLRDEARTRDEILAIVSHDLRSPLQAILMGAQVLATHADGTVVSVASRVRSSARRATKLIENLLDFTEARVRGTIPISRTACDVGAVVRGAVDEIRLAAPDRVIAVDVAGEPRAYVDGDRIAQVVANLVSNAVRYGAPGAQVDVRVGLRDSELVLEVHNEGRPIPPALLGQLFDPYRRGSSQARGSVGLGLFITKQIVDAHGGAVDVRSSDAEGTTFRVRVPARERG